MNARMEGEKMENEVEQRLIDDWRRSEKARSMGTVCPDCGKGHSTVMKPSTADACPKDAGGFPLVLCLKCKRAMGV